MDNKKKNKKRNVGIQTIVLTKEYVLPSIAVQHNLETIEYPKFLAIPHNILAIIITCSLIFYLSMKSTGDSQETIRKGVIGCTVAFLSFGSIYLPDSML